MSIEKKLETSLVEHLRGILPPSVIVRGSFTYGADDDDGEDDLVESSLEAYCDIKCPAATFPKANAPVGEWKPTVAFFVPVAIDPTGEKVDEFWSALSDTLWELQESLTTAAQIFSALDCFALHAFSVENGTPLEIAESYRTISVTLLIRGRYIKPKSE